MKRMRDGLLGDAQACDACVVFGVVSALLQVS